MQTGIPDFCKPHLCRITFSQDITLIAKPIIAIVFLIFGAGSYDPGAATYLKFLLPKILTTTDFHFTNRFFVYNKNKKCVVNILRFANLIKTKNFILCWWFSLFCASLVYFQVGKAFSLLFSLDCCGLRVSAAVAANVED